MLTWPGLPNGFQTKRGFLLRPFKVNFDIRSTAYENICNVIHTQVELQYDMPDFGLLTFATYDYYIARNIGIVRVETTGDPILTGGQHTLTDLIEYSIK